MNVKTKRRIFRHVISTPFIWAVLVPLVFLDVVVEIYHRICFPLYGLKQIDRWQYIKIDRHKLSYLTFLEKIGCMYCGYANGLLPYTSAIAARTEEYWCGIMHEDNGRFKPPEHHKKFLKYGDKQAYQKLKP